MMSQDDMERLARQMSSQRDDDDRADYYDDLSRKGASPIIFIAVAMLVLAGILAAREILVFALWWF